MIYSQSPISVGSIGSFYVEPKAEIPSVEGSLDATITTTLFVSDVIHNSVVISQRTTYASTALLIEGISSSVTLSQETSVNLAGFLGNIGNIALGQSTSTTFSGILPIQGSVDFSQASSFVASYLIIEGSLNGSISASIAFDNVGIDVVGILNLSQSTRYRSSGFTPYNIGSVEEAGSIFVMNVQNQGVSSYSNFNFNSFFQIGNDLYGCADTGLYKLEGSVDVTDKVVAVVESGSSNFDSPKLKAIADCYIDIRANEDVYFGLVANEQIDRNEYVIQFDQVEGMHRRRVKVAKGIKASTWKIKIRSEDDAFFVQKVEVIPKELDRSI
jgi:hypothetical protein